MQNIHLLVGDKEEGPFSEEEIEKMYVSGRINAETLHWKEGLPDWQAIGLRDARTGKAHETGATVAPPRRNKDRVYEPADLRSRKQSKDFESARIKPATVGKTLILIGFFFLIVTGVFILLSRSLPDNEQRFKEAVENAPIKPLP